MVFCKKFVQQYVKLAVSIQEVDECVAIIRHRHMKHVPQKCQQNKLAFNLEVSSNVMHENDVMSLSLLRLILVFFMLYSNFYSTVGTEWLIGLSLTDKFRR